MVLQACVSYAIYHIYLAIMFTVMYGMWRRASIRVRTLPLGCCLDAQRKGMRRAVMS
jgi:hypothetical protein